MKIFTRCFSLLAVWMLPSLLATAATITVQVGDNFYQGPAGSSTITMATSDVLTFQYSGNSSHPTISDSSPVAWATFPLNSSATTKTFPANTFTPGSYPFHCQVHGVSMSGMLIVTGNATATANARSLAVPNVYPNPSRGQITVQLNQKPGTDYKLRLSNIIGQEIRTIALRPELTPAGLPLDLSDLHAGMYFYSLLVDGKVVSTKRLVLQN